MASSASSGASALFWLTLYGWTRPPVALLWTYLWWYIYVISTHFTPSAEVWGNAAGIFIVVSIALNFNAYHPPLIVHLKTNYVSIFLFSVIPFLVASYASTVGMANAQSPGTFYAIIPIRGSEAAVLFGVGVSLITTLLAIHVLTGRYIITNEQKEELRLKMGHAQAKDQNRNRFQFFVRWFRPPLAVLWGIFFWYVWVVAQNPPPSQVWVTSLLSSCFVGVAHNANVYKPTLREYLSNQPIKAGRFFLVPFCVASYSGAATAHKFSFFPPGALLSSIGAFLSVAVAAACYFFWYTYADPETGRGALDLTSSNGHDRREVSEAAGDGDCEMDERGNGDESSFATGTRTPRKSSQIKPAKAKESCSDSDKTMSTESGYSSDVAKLEAGNTLLEDISR